jgi:hypothetical protein
MSGLICECNEPVKNLGIVNCVDKFGKFQRLTFVPIYKTDGTENYINAETDALDAAYFNALQYNADTNARYYPLPLDMKNVENAKGEPVYKTYDDDTKEFLRFGARTLKALLAGDVAPVMVGKINSKRCGKMGIFITSDTKNFGGIEKTKGKLYPIQLADNTMNALFSFANNSANEEIMISMDFDPSVLDEKFSWISSSDIGLDLITAWKGKVDTNISQLAANRSTTTFKVDIYSDYGTAKKKLPVTGLVTADFVLYNITDSASLAITSATEDTLVPGRYAFVISVAQTATDELDLSLAVTANAKPFEDAAWSDVNILLQ